MDFINELDTIIELSKAHLGFALLCILILWAVHLVNGLLGYRLNVLGIYPRKIWGLFGIIFSPFLHGNFEHLFVNSIPAFILIDLVSIYGESTFFSLTIFIVLVSGLGVWLFGRSAFHVGASALMMGYWGFLLMRSFHEGTAMALILALICLYYLGGMAMSLLPLRREASWEGHLLGCLAGMAYVYVAPYL